jgi:hypothetical protein
MNWQDLYNPFPYPKGGKNRDPFSEKQDQLFYQKWFV